MEKWQPQEADGRPAAIDAEEALREADAAVEAAEAESGRWGGSDRPPPQPQPRFW